MAASVSIPVFGLEYLKLQHFVDADEQAPDRPVSLASNHDARMQNRLQGRKYRRLGHRRPSDQPPTADWPSKTHGWWLLHRDTDCP